MAQGEKSDPGKGGPPPEPGRTGQGYEHTADTKVPSPMSDYRSRFETRYAARTGTNLVASGQMGLGDLRDYQRKYFDSFTLRADVGTTDDLRVSLLKRRWIAIKEGKW